MATETRNHFQIVDSIKAGTPYEFTGKTGGRTFEITYKNGLYLVVNKTCEPGVKKFRAQAVGLAKVSQIIFNSLA